MSPEVIKMILRTMDKASDATGFKIVLIDKSDGGLVGFDRLLNMVDDAFKQKETDNAE